MFCVTKTDITNLLVYAGLIYILLGSQVPPERVIKVAIVGVFVYFIFFSSSTDDKLPLDVTQHDELEEDIEIK